MRYLRNVLKLEINLPEEIKKQKKYKITEEGILKFCTYVIRFHLGKKRELDKILEEASKGKKIVTLKNKKETELYLQNLFN